MNNHQRNFCVERGDLDYSEDSKNERMKNENKIMISLLLVKAGTLSMAITK